MQNHLRNQTSPYLIQHAENPVDWYPWCDEAFERAKAEDKPIFLSIGYSTCHWCHVMAHESFEDEQVADILNRYFISIKVDKEERPDIDSIYMAVCEAYTGSGGWPTSIFMTPEQKPFFAGTYFPKTARYGQMGLIDLLLAVNERWETDREELLKSADEIVAFLDSRNKAVEIMENNVQERLVGTAVKLYKRMYDYRNGGFGDAPKFPTPHNLLFLMKYYEKSKDEDVINMVEKTLIQMYRGGIFDHIGGGFSRYSTDSYFLAPHFEKMLYDNALLILAYCRLYEITKSYIYRDVAEKTAAYVIGEMTSSEGGFYSAQDADSEGVEGKYYLFEPDEIIGVIGEEAGKAFNQYFDITEGGNFEGKSIPNLLKNDDVVQSVRGVNRGKHSDTGEHEMRDFDESISRLYEYRKSRYALHLDDKILTSWNSLMIAAMCNLYRVTENETYLEVAVKAQSFILDKLYEEDTLYISYRKGQRSGKGFFDDYAYEIYSLLALYQATLDNAYLDKAKRFCGKTVLDFSDRKYGGFFLYGKENEQLITRPKETYDGAIFSGNSAMAYNLLQLYYITGDEYYGELAEHQLAFMSTEASRYPAGYSMFLLALSDYMDPPEKITIAVKNKKELKGLSCKIPLNSVVCVVEGETKEYPLKDDKTTFYVCRGRKCLPPVNSYE